MIIKPSPRKKKSRKIFFFSLLLAAVAGAAGSYYFGFRELPAQYARVSELRQSLAELKQDRERLETENILLEQQFEIIRGANNRLLETEREYQQEIAELRNELAFYRRLAGASGRLEGLSINRLLLLPTANPRVYQYRLTLTQNLQKARRIQGTVQISLRGSQANQPALLDWKALNPEAGGNPEFSFKYFQQLEGYLTLPEGFVPETLEITLRPQKKPRSQQSFSWRESLLNES